MDMQINCFRLSKLYARLLVIIIISICVSSCSGCSSTNNSDEEESTYKSQSYKLVEQHINEMTEKPWDKSVFLEIRDKQIPMLKKNSERMSATTLLETEYSKLLVRDANDILQQGCPKTDSHSMLEKLFQELKDYPKVPRLAEVLSIKKLHDNAFTFARNAVGRQTVSNYRTAYNKQYEQDKISEAKEYLSNSKIKCNQLKTKLTKLTEVSAYSGRRNTYCKDIYSSYMQCPNSARSELNAAKANLGVYAGNSQTLSDWKAQMDEHFNELNKKEK